MRVRLLLVLTIISIASLALAQQSSQQPIGQPSTPQQSAQQPMTMSQTSGQEAVIKPLQSASLKTVAGLPDCLTATVERGDPKTGPYVAYTSMRSGCTIPAHTHSWGEQVMFVSGGGQFTMKGQQPQTVSEGTYVNIPANHQHQLTCPNGCTYYVSREGAADIHYVDAAGKEISPETALAAVGEHPAGSVAAQK